MAGFSVKSFDQILADMIAWIVSSSPQITDLNPGSVLRSFCEASALSLEELYVSAYLGFKRTLATVPENVFNFTKKAGTKASTSLVFGRSGTTGTVTIPAGTVVATPSNLVFVTTASGSILNGNTTSSAIPAQAYDVGSIYNVSISSITVMKTDINGVQTVTNSVAATGGVDVETDYQFNLRFQQYIEGLGRSNIAGLIAGALSDSSITSASVLEHFPPSSNVNAHLYIDDGTSTGVSVSTIARIQALIDGDGTQNNPGYRAAGVNVVVAAPGIVTQNVAVTVKISGVDQAQAILDINNALATYVNNLGVGNYIILSELVAAVMGVFGVTDATVTTPVANVTITASQVGRLGTVTVTVA